MLLSSHARRSTATNDADTPGSGPGSRRASLAGWRPGLSWKGGATDPANGGRTAMAVRAQRHVWSVPLIPITLVAGLVLAGAVPAVASEAHVGQPVGCGSVLTRSTVLQTDLLDCPGNGLVIGADGITVDPNGHRISGRIISTGGGV